VKKFFLIVAAVALMGIFSAFSTGANNKTPTPPNVPTATQMNFVGDKTKMIYHYPTCKYVPKDPANIVPLDSPMSARLSKFKPCRKCHPPEK
jgi:hypothetical protein